MVFAGHGGGLDAVGVAAEPVDVAVGAHFDKYFVT